MVLCGQRCDGRKGMIPTVVRKSANTEGLVCLLVSRGVGPLHLVNRDSFPKKKFQRRNSRRGIPHPSRSLAKLDTYHDPVLSKELESTENQHLGDIFNGNGQSEDFQAENQREIHSSRYVASDRKANGFEIHREESDDLHNNFTENMRVISTESIRHESEKDGLVFPSSHPPLQSGPIIQEDRLYHFPSDPVSSNGRKGDESLSNMTLQNSIERQNFQTNSNRTLVLEPPAVHSPHHDVKERSTKGRQFPLLRPIKPENSHKVLQRNKPLVKVSLIVKAPIGNVQFDGGEVVVDDQFLEEGMHTLQFEHVVEENEHRLRVSLDGHEGKFEGSTRPRRPLDFQFHEVWIKIQGPVTFVGNNSCEGEQNEGGHGMAEDPMDPPIFPEEKGQDEEKDDEAPVRDEAQVNPLSPTANIYPLQAIINEMVNNRSMMHKIVINSTVTDSSLSLSYINNSTLINTSVDNSIVIDAKISNSTLVNSTLQNVHLINCEVTNSRTLNSKTENTKIFNLLPYNATRDFGFDPLHDQITFEDFDESPALDNANAKIKGVDITMMVFGVLGLIVLVLVMVGVVLLITRHIIKKKKEMLLVRSAVMGSVKSW
ncbi:hypothetical protein FHG87_012958 [Trinorchestia longiramus]|nr:hypothetical protein FHG87_012958 [Trinorchestia longiramus]